MRGSLLQHRCVRAAGLLPLVVSALLVLGPTSSEAQLRDVEVLFQTPGDPVDGYRLYLIDPDTRVETLLDLGMVIPDAQGIGGVVLSLEASRAYELQMTAYNEGGESLRSNTREVAAQLSVDPILPTYGPGKHVLTLTGTGFTRKPKIKFENGEGKKPKVKVLQVLDDETLEVMLKVKAGKVAGQSTWDMRVRIKGGEEIVVQDAVTVDSL